MLDVPALPATARGRNRRSAVLRGPGAQPVEIFAPDRYSTDLLLEFAAPVFFAELAPGCVWVVRLEPPEGAEWVLELLSLVQRWLESARLPWVNVLYGGRSYLIRDTNAARQVPSRPQRIASSAAATD
jgi:hypothetical protein